jgi:hypothetical protein
MILIPRQSELIAVLEVLDAKELQAVPFQQISFLFASRLAAGPSPFFRRISGEQARVR